MKVCVCVGVWGEGGGLGGADEGAGWAGGGGGRGLGGAKGGGGLRPRAPD